MKILLATSFFPPTHTGGTEERTLGYALKLLERGYEVQVVCAGEWEKGGEHWNGYRDETYRGVPVRRIDLNWKKSRDPNGCLYDNRQVERHFRGWLATWKPDLVHVTSCLTLSASILPVVKDAGLPLVLTLTDFWFSCPKLTLLRGDGELCDGSTTSRECIQCLGSGSGIYRRLSSLVPDSVAIEILHRVSRVPSLGRQRGFRGVALDMDRRKGYLAEVIGLPDVITAPSSHLRNVLHATGMTEGIQVIQSGHDLSWLEPDIPEVPSDAVRFGYVGQITPAKGVHTMIAAFQARAFGHKAELRIHGPLEEDSGYSRELQAIPGPNGEAITFHGPFPHDELGSVLAGIDVLIVPSLWHENNPRVIQEAYASKTPVIASDVGGIAEYVQHDHNGFLFERGDVSGLSLLLHRIVEEPSQIERLAANIPEVKSVEQEMDELEVIYHRLCPGAGATRDVGSGQ